MSNIFYNLNLVLQISLKPFNLDVKHLQWFHVSFRLLSYNGLLWWYNWLFDYFVVSKWKPTIECWYLLGRFIGWLSYLLDGWKRRHSERHVPSCLWCHNWWLILHIYQRVETNEVSIVVNKIRLIKVTRENIERICLWITLRNMRDVMILM